jgi:hypothetical protein
MDDRLLGSELDGSLELWNRGVVPVRAVQKPAVLIDRNAVRRTNGYEMFGQLYGSVEGLVVLRVKPGEIVERAWLGWLIGQ